LLRRFLLAILIFLILVVIAADRGGAIVGAHVLASKLQTDEHLPDRPAVKIHGIPFLTQALRGKYRDVSVVADEVPVDQVQVTTLTAHLQGVHVPMSKVIQDSVSRVPVDHIDGTAFVSFADANTYLANHRVAGQLVTIAPGANGTVTVTDQTGLAGKRLTLHANGTISVARNVVTVSVSRLTGLTGKRAAADEVAIRRNLHIALPLQGLPFQMQLRSVTVTSAGLSGVGEANNVVLGSHG
jgi:hypothetical protein